MTQKCKCEHWEVCPTCCPEWYDMNGNRLPPPLTPLQTARAEIDRLRNELEIERMRLAGCGAAALGYFDGCKEEYRSASLDDVLRLKAKYDFAIAALEIIAGIAPCPDNLMSDKDIARAAIDVARSEG